MTHGGWIGYKSRTKATLTSVGVVSTTKSQVSFYVAEGMPDMFAFNNIAQLLK